MNVLHLEKKVYAKVAGFINVMCRITLRETIQSHSLWQSSLVLLDYFLTAIVLLVSTLSCFLGRYIYEETFSISSVAGDIHRRLGAGLLICGVLYCDQVMHHYMSLGHLLSVGIYTLSCWPLSSILVNMPYL